MDILHFILFIFREKFINLVDPEKCGLPRVLDTLEVSCKTKFNIRHLANMIYDTAFSLRSQVNYLHQLFYVLEKVRETNIHSLRR